MIATIQKVDNPTITLRALINGARLKVVEKGKGEKEETFSSRAEAIAAAEKLLARRTAKGAWQSLGRTDTDRFLMLMDELSSLQKTVQHWPGLSRSIFQLLRMQPCFDRDIAELQEKLVLPLPTDFLEYARTSRCLMMNVELGKGIIGEQFKLTFRSHELAVTDHSLVIGQAENYRWDTAVLDLPTGMVLTGIKGVTVLDQHACFSDFFEFELRELKNHLLEIRSRLERDGS
jgi:hypothetical protein